MRARPIRLLVCAFLALSTAACDRANENALDVVLVGDPDTAYSQDIPDGQAARLLRAATAPALAGIDGEGRIAPALAESWIVTDDGMSYIFRLRARPEESDEPLTAEDVRAALLERIDALADRPLGDDLKVITGVVARTGRVIEIELARPMPDFLQLLAQPELAMPALGTANAPMRLEREQGRLVTETPGPRRILQFAVRPSREAVALFQSGKAEILLGGGLEALPYVELGGLLRGTIRLDPVNGLFGLAVAGDKGFLADPANRKALAMAIDRDSLMTPFGIGGWVPARGILPPGLSLVSEGGLADPVPIEDRRAIASGRVAGWKAINRQAPILSIDLPQGKGGDVLFESLRADLAKIGVGLVRARGEGPADLQLVDEVATHARPEWYFNRLTCKARPRSCNEDADEVLTLARTAPQGEERRALLAEAEARYAASGRFIPFGPPIRFSLVRGGVAGFAVNGLGFHPLPPLALSSD